MGILKMRSRRRGRQRLVLHIGTHKTGSTALQTFCFDHRSALAAAGVHYPSAMTKWKGHHPLAWSLGLEHPHRDHSITDRMATDAILDSFAASKCETLLLSSEDFEFLTDPRPLIDLFDGFEIQVVVYLRRQDRYLVSEYNQHVRMYETRFAGTLSEFLAVNDLDERFDFERLLAPWTETLGESALSVRSFEAATQGGLIADFLGTVGFTPAVGSDARMFENVSLDPRATEVLRHLNQVPLERPEHVAIVKALREITRDRVLVDLFGRHMTKADLDTIGEFVRRYRASNERVLDRFESLRGDIGLAAIDYAGEIDGGLDVAPPLDATLAHVVAWLAAHQTTI